jgi:hypothetical protein
MNRTLFSLAIIRINWELFRKDYIENFVPLFATLIKKHNYSEISIEKLDVIREDFKNEYGLFIPSNPTITILNRLSKKNLITKEHGKFIPVKENIDKIDITSKSNQITREFEHVIHSIKEFIKKKHDLEVEQNDIEEALICYLRKHDLDLLFAAERNSLLPKISPNKKLQFLINEFIGNAFRTEPHLFKFIVNLSIGHALSSTILFNDFKQYAGKLKNLSLFLDTPFVFNLLGINGIHKKSLAEELVSILRNEGVKIYILEITDKEVTSNLEEALKLLEKGKNDPTKGPLTFKACLENGFNENDVEQMLLELPEIFTKLGIGYDDVPSYDEFREFQIDEEKLYNTIIEAYGLNKPKPDSNPENEKSSDEKDDKEDKINNTIFRDVQVLSGIYRYRLGNNPKTLKDCKYLFITTNSSLAYASRKFERFENGKKYSLPTCLTDVFLGTLIWLHSPAQVVTFSEKKIIADCYAALRPDEKIIAKYLDDVEKLKDKGEISLGNYILLRTHRAAINILENKTLGDINEFKPDTTEEILAELLAQIKSEEREKYLAEQSEHDKTQAKLDAEKEKHNSAISLLEKKEQEDIQRQLERNKRIRISSEKKARITIVILQTLLILLLFVSIGVIIINNFTAVILKSWLYILGWTIFTLTGLLNILTGFNFRQTRSLLHDKIAAFYENKIIKKIEKYG